MHPITAGCVVLASLVLALVRRRKAGKIRRAIGRRCAGAVVLAGLLTLGAMLTNWEAAIAWWQYGSQLNPASKEGALGRIGVTLGLIGAALLLLDIGLPDMSGLQVLEHIRRHGTSTEVVIFTKPTSPEMAARCPLLGANHFVDKAHDISPIIESLWTITAPKDRI